ncbi:MAG: histidine triad nucleotide-binding protein [Deltaproteobacteria bacterium]|nr:histidine triad nucleotide-binding protein [Deltaproteobacteria bacterium]
MTCIFCQIAVRRLPADILYEDDDLIVFKEVNPEAPIHLLIVSRVHIDTLNSLDEQSVGLMAKMVLVAKRIAEDLKTQSGYRLVINCGREAGQVVLHLHMHFMGGWRKK